MENEKTAGGLRCSEVLAMLSDYVDGELSAEQVRQVEAHVGECDNCLRFGGSFAQMLKAAAAVSAEPAVSADLAARIQAQIS